MTTGKTITQNFSAQSAGLKALVDFSQLEPKAALLFYDHCIILRHQTENGETSYPVDPKDLATTLGQHSKMESGLLPPDLIYVAEDGLKRVIVGYRAPQYTGIWVEGLDAPYRIPMPGFLLARTTVKGTKPEYEMYAVKKRPVDGWETLYKPPLAHTLQGGGICWGTVKRPSKADLHPTDMKKDWDALLGSRFGNHAITGRSVKYPEDIRKLYAHMERYNQKYYPMDDLVDAGKAVKVWLEGLL